MRVSETVILSLPVYFDRTASGGNILTLQFLSY